MKKLIFALLVIFLSCEKECIEPEFCNCQRTEFCGELYVVEYIGSNCGYEHSYKGVISVNYDSESEVLKITLFIDVILLTNRHYEKEEFVYIENEEIIKL